MIFAICDNSSARPRKLMWDGSDSKAASAVRPTTSGFAYVPPSTAVPQHSERLSSLQIIPNWSARLEKTHHCTAEGRAGKPTPKTVTKFATVPQCSWARRATDVRFTPESGHQTDPRYVRRNSSGSLAMFAAILRAFCEAKDALVLSVAGVTAIIVWLPSSCG